MQRIKQINVAFFVHHSDFVFTNGDEFGMRNFEFAAVRSADEEWLKPAAEFLANFIKVHLRTLGNNKGPINREKALPVMPQ